MKRRGRLLLFLLCLLLDMHAQDAEHAALRPARPLLSVDTLPLWSARTDTVPLPSICWPEAFAQLSPNLLTDDKGVLQPFWEKLRLLRLGASEDTIRVLHVGDSHIRGHIFPRTAGERMGALFSTLSYADMGINGAFCTTFTRPGRIAEIAALHPDLLILSFGTNESHNRRYDTAIHYRQMDELVKLLHEALPGVPLLMTTPPGSYDSFRKRGQRRTYQVNPRTEAAAQTIRRYAAEHGLAVWDLYTICGGAGRACLNWQQAGLMRPDHVHYLPDGYRLQGELLSQALLKAYNAYVEH